jgi:hypothetical protein
MPSHQSPAAAVEGCRPGPPGAVIYGYLNSSMLASTRLCNNSTQPRAAASIGKLSCSSKGRRLADSAQILLAMPLGQWEVLKIYAGTACPAKTCWDFIPFTAHSPFASDGTHPWQVYTMRSSESALVLTSFLVAVDEHSASIIARCCFPLG